MNVFLHIMHGWGGGLQSWVRDFSNGDDVSQHIILKAIGNWGAFGEGLLLMDSVDSDLPLRYWNLKQPIKATAVHHPVYQKVINEILREYGVTHIIVSSLIGHALDIFDADRPTLHVLHDYYPFCPALNIYFDSVCQDCDIKKLGRCFDENPYNRYFLNVQPLEWQRLRESYLKKIGDSHVKLVAPTDNVRSNVMNLYGRHVDAENIVVIPHGIKDIRRLKGRTDTRARKVLVVPGRITESKGLEIFRACIDALSAVADIYFIGCGVQGVREFSGRPGVKCIENYLWEELPDIVDSIDPDAAVLMPTVPETFSYTLSEMWALGVPVIATNIGSMSSRIEHGVNGHLIDISTAPESLVAALHDVQSLQVVRENIRRQEIVRIEDMLNEYYRILNLGRRNSDPGKSVRRAVSKEHSSSSHKLKQLIFRSHIRIQDSIVGLDFSQKTRWQILSTYRGLVYFPRIIMKKILK